MNQKLVLFFLLGFLGPAVPLSSLRAEEAVEFAAGEILLKFKEGTTEDEQLKVFNKYSLKKIQFNQTIQTYLVLATEDDITVKVSLLNQEPSIEYAQPNYVKKKSSVPNDPYYSSQWHLPHIGMPTAWSEFTGITEVRVAVIDTGVNKSLTDLAGVLISDREWDYINGDSDASDTDGHGTLVAGIIAATANNNVGIAGICSQARILPFRQDGFVSDINDAMVRAYNSGCKIINASYGNYTESLAERSQISWLNDRGVLVVCSAGNDGTNNDTRRHYPSSYDLPNIISVANSTASSVLSSSSNYGSTTVDIAAPGTGILSTLGVGEDYRGIISQWTFDSGWDGWLQSNVSGYGFYWSSSSKGLFSEYDLSWQYQAFSNVALQSPLVDCRNFVATELFTIATGSLGLGDALGIYSGTSTLAASTRSALLTGNVNANYTNRTMAIDQALGRIWYYFTSDAFFNGFFGILYADLTGIPIYSFSSGTSFAAPMVTGLAAMVMSQNPDLTHLQVKDVILQTAQKISALNGKVVSGGIVDATAALREAKARNVVNPPVIQNVVPLNAEIGVALTYNITASNNPNIYNASGLPSGLSIDTSTGIISGTPSQAGTFTVQISASNSAGTGSANLSIIISKATPTLVSFPLASDILDGQNLSISVLSGGSASVGGIFQWVNSSLIPSTFFSLQEVIFLPSENTKYNSFTISVGVSVNEPPGYVKSIGDTLIILNSPSSLIFDGLQKNFTAIAMLTNASSRGVLPLGNVGDPTRGYGTISSLRPDDYRIVSAPGVDGVFRPNRDSTLISSTGLRISFPNNLVSADPGGDTIRPPWKKNPDSTGGGTGDLALYFSALGINWASNSLFAVPCAGITYDLNELKPSGKEYTKFTTYFAMHSGSPMGDAAYAIIVDGNLLKHERDFTALAPYSGLIEVDIPSNARFLTLVVGDNGDDMHWDHGVFVNPTLYSAAQIPLLIQYEGMNPTSYGPSTNPPTNPGQYQLTMSDLTGRYSGTYTTNITILKITPVISNIPTASGIIFGQALSNSILSNGVASVSGSWAWATGSITPSVSITNRYSVVFTPSNTTTHSLVTTNIPLAVSKATPLIIWSNPAPITFGTALSTNTQLNASANAAGSFRFTPTNGAVLNAGTHILTAVFTASNTNNFFSPRTNTVSLTVNKATPVISNLPTARPIVLGQALSNSVLSNGVANVSGRWAWTSPSNTPGAGTSKQGVTFLPTATSNFNAVTTNVSITVNLPSPTITRLPTASAITFGQALSNSVLSNGVASVPGNWNWEVPATAPNAGTKGRFPIVFTPANTATHRPVITNVPLVVNRAPQTIIFTLPATNAFTSNGLIPLNGTSSSGLPVAYKSKNAKLLPIVGTNAVMKGRGPNTITASQAGNSNYLAASNVVRAIVVQ